MFAKKVLENLADLIIEELNIKEIFITPNEHELVNLNAKANFKTLGKKLGKMMKVAAKKISSLDSEEINKIQNGKNISFTINGKIIDLRPEDILLQREEKEDLLVETDNTLTVALDTELSVELIHEGLAREFINKVQNMRKEMDLDVMDRIRITYHGSDKLNSALQKFSDFVCVETLSDQLEPKKIQAGAEWDLNGEPCRINLIKKEDD